jgi:hypothetical protein
MQGFRHSEDARPQKWGLCDQDQEVNRAGAPRKEVEGVCRPWEPQEHRNLQEADT